jgi:hypothetical protein
VKTTDDLEGLKNRMLVNWGSQLTAQKERLGNLLNSWVTSVPYTPQSLAEIVRSDPSVAVADAENILLAAGATPVEAIRYAEEVRHEHTPGADLEAGLLRWAKQAPMGTVTSYWAIRHVLRVVGTELIRNELERFAANLERHYILVPRSKVEEAHVRDEKTITEKPATPLSEED